MILFFQFKYRLTVVATLLIFALVANDFISNAAENEKSYRKDIENLFAKKYIFKKDYPVIDSLIQVVRNDQGINNIDFVNLAVLRVNKIYGDKSPEVRAIYDDLVAASTIVDVPYDNLKKALKKIALDYSVEKNPKRYDTLLALWELDKKHATPTDTIDYNIIFDLKSFLDQNKRYKEGDSLILQYVNIANALYGTNSTVMEKALELRISNYIFWNLDNTVKGIKISKDEFKEEAATYAALVSVTENLYGQNHIKTQNALSDVGKRLIYTHNDSLTEEEKNNMRKTGIDALKKWYELKGDTLDISYHNNKQALIALFQNISDKNYDDTEAYNECLRYFNIYKDAVKQKYGEISEEYYYALSDGIHALDADDKLNLALEQADVAKQLYGEYDYRYKSSYDLIVSSNNLKKDYGKSIETLEKYNPYKGKSLEETMVLLSNHAHTYERYGQYNKARNYYKKGLEIALNNDTLSSWINSFFHLYVYNLSQYGKSDSIPIITKEIISKISDKPALQAKLLTVSSNLLEPQNSIQLLTEEIEKYPVIKNDTSYAPLLFNLASKYMDTGELEKSILTADNAISISGCKYPEIRKLMFREMVSFYKDTIYSNYIDINDKALKAIEENVKDGINSHDYRALLYRRYRRALRAKRIEDARTAYDMHTKIKNSAEDKWVIWTVAYIWNYTSYLYSMHLYGFYDSKDAQYAELCLLENNKKEALSTMLSELNKRNEDPEFYANYIVENNLDLLSFYKQSDMDFFSKWASKLEDERFICRAYNAALKAKQLKLTTINSIRYIIANSNNEDIKKKWNELIALEQSIQENVANNLPIDDLNMKHKSLQTSIFVDANQLGDFSKIFNIKWEDIRDSLGEEDCAVEFTSFKEDDSETYCALVLTPNDTPRLIKLFNASDININNTSSLDSSYYSVIWKPVLSHISTVKNIYFSPHGLLHMIPLEYMKIDDSSYISDYYNLHRLSSTRNICENKKYEISGASIFGGINYDGENDNQYKAVSDELDRDMIEFIELIGEEERAGVSYLPGTKLEADTISSMLSSKIPVELFTGDRASELAIKNIKDNPHSILHIATHGFYISPKSSSKNKTDLLSAMSDNRDLSQDDRNMSRSGILFYGANNTLKGLKNNPENDGILTAKEVSQMNLKGTDLVVLSACQSALGEVSGEGVFGLQRGFKIAGAQTIMMSLWKVNDTATRILMTKFYEGLINGMSKQQALLAAQKYLREYEYVNKTDGKKSNPFSNPRYWAAFILLDA